VNGLAREPIPIRRAGPACAPAAIRSAGMALSSPADSRGRSMENANAMSPLSSVVGARAAKSLAACLSLSLAMACRASDYRPIPNGMYSTPAGNEYISVHDGSLRLHVLPWSEMRPPRYSDAAYQYTVLSDSRIVIYTMTSAEAVNGIGGFSWRWDGERIVQQDPRRPNSKDKLYTRVP
jgi:hypothetical protein